MAQMSSGADTKMYLRGQPNEFMKTAILRCLEYSEAATKNGY